MRTGHPQSPSIMNYSTPSSLLSLSLTNTSSSLGIPSRHPPCSKVSSLPHTPIRQTSCSASVAGQEAGQSRPPLPTSTPHTSTRYFSNAVATPQNRDVFANNILDIYKRYNLDGIDIDWEYPGQIGQQGNTESPTDSANMLQFFKVLRQKLPSGAMISAAVQDSPFTGPDGQPMKDVSSFSNFVDWITLMNYDTYGSTLIPLIHFIHTQLYLTLSHPSPAAPWAKCPSLQRMRQFLPAHPECRERFKGLDIGRFSFQQDGPRCPWIRLHRPIQL